MALVIAGHPVGESPSGQPDTEDRKAIRAFQIDQDIVPTGFIDDATQKAVDVALGFGVNWSLARAVWIRSDHVAPIRAIAFADDQVATVDRNNIFRIFLIDNGYSFLMRQMHNILVKDIRFSNKQDQLISIGARREGYEINFWNLDHGEDRVIFHENANVSRSDILMHFYVDFYTIFYENSGEMRFRHLESDRYRFSIKCNIKRKLITFSPNGSIAICLGSDDVLQIHRASDGLLLRKLAWRGGETVAIALAPDGQSLATASNDRVVRFWRLTDGSLIGSLETQVENIVALEFSTHGELFAVGGEDGTVALHRR